MEWIGFIFVFLIVLLIFTKVAEAALTEPDPLPVKYDDGGRLSAGYRGKAGDCVTRAIALATGYSYDDVYKLVDRAGRESIFKNNNAHRGVNGYITDALCEGFGGTFYKVPRGTYLRPGVLPPGTHIAMLREHVVAVIDGVAYDNHETPFKQELDGYWTFPDRRTS